MARRQLNACYEAKKSYICLFLELNEKIKRASHFTRENVTNTNSTYHLAVKSNHFGQQTET